MPPQLNREIERYQFEALMAVHIVCSHCKIAAPCPTVYAARDELPGVWSSHHGPRGDGQGNAAAAGGRLAHGHDGQRVGGQPGDSAGPFFVGSVAEKAGAADGTMGHLGRTIDPVILIIIAAILKSGCEVASPSGTTESKRRHGKAAMIMFSRAGELLAMCVAFPRVAGMCGVGQPRGPASQLVPQITIVSPPRPKFSQILGGLPIFPSRLLGVSRWRPSRDGRCRSSEMVWQTCG